MKGPAWFLPVLALCCLFAPAGTAGAEKLTTPTEATELPRVSARALELLSGVSPKPDSPKENNLIIQEQSVLWGELFEPGRVVALLALEAPEDASRVVLAHWHSGQWQVEQAIDVPIYWKSPSIPAADIALLPENLPDKAFSLRRFGPAEQVFLTVSTFHSRHRMARFVFAYDAKSHRLETDAEYSVEEPEWRDGYLVFTNDSGNKAWWNEELFYQIKGHRLQFRGALLTGSYQGDDTIIHVTFPASEKSKEPTTKWRFVSTQEEPSDFKVYAGEEQQPETQPVGGLHVPVESFANLGAHLLQKLSGVPATMARYRHWDGGRMMLLSGALIPDQDVKVSGDAALVRALSSHKQK